MLTNFGVLGCALMLILLVSTAGSAQPTGRQEISSSSTSPSSRNTGIEELQRENDLLKAEVKYLREMVLSTEKRIEKLKEDVYSEKSGVFVSTILNLPGEWKQRLSLGLLDLSNTKDFDAAKMAEADVVKGKLNILTGGLNRYTKEVRHLLQEKYDIVVMDMASCTDGAAIFRFMDAYNSVSKKAIEKKYGKDFFDKVFDRTPTSAPTTQTTRPN